jgi:hypothetical protein
MRELYKALFRRAADATREAQARAEHLKREILDAERRKGETESALRFAQSAVDRVDRFDPEIGGDLQCPDCWINNGVRSKLVSIPSDSEIDWFRCETCHQKLSTE